MHPKGLLILGCGGHARSVADVALSTGIESLYFIDDTAQSDETLFGFPILANFQGALPENWQCLPAAGDNYHRQRQLTFALTQGWPIASLISPHATVGPNTHISPGCFIGHHAHVGPMSVLGKSCIINTGAVVEHDCHLGDYVHASINSTLAGRVKIGDAVFLGAGSAVIDALSIAKDIKIGAGAVVVSSLNDPGTYIGTPAKIVTTCL